jgi:arylsulfatase A-like enzyme
MNRRDFLRLVSLAAASAALPKITFADAPSTRSPNIILILTDDLGYGDLGCYGQKRIQTPHIDRLAAEGMRFTDAYAGSTVCAPSRCCLLTGKHTGRAQIRGNSRVVLTEKTIVHTLKKAGYATACVGKWGMGPVAGQGLDFFWGYIDHGHAHNAFPPFIWRNDKKEPLRNVLTKPSKNGTGKAVQALDFVPDLGTDEALKWIEQERAKPFFLQLNYTIPHANNEAKTIDVPDLGRYADKDWPAEEKRKAAAITCLDSYVGRLLEKLKELSLDRETVIFFTSDNGPHKEAGIAPAFHNSSGPLRGIKRDLYEGGIRVPMIVRWPGQVPAGKVSALPWALWDFASTATAIAGPKAIAALPDKLDGVSVLPTLTGEEQKLDRYLYWEFYERHGHWKLVRFRPAGQPPVDELYDLSRDIAEQNNLASQHPDIVARLARYCAEAHTPSKVADWQLPGDA